MFLKKGTIKPMLWGVIRIKSKIMHLETPTQYLASNMEIVLKLCCTLESPI
jgi:hypothetical protein